LQCPGKLKFLSEKIFIYFTNLFRLNIYVEPIPGSLLVWYNVDNYGRNDEV